MPTSLGLALTLCLLLLGWVEGQVNGTQCTKPPQWRIGENYPMKNALGTVTLCQKQAPRLDSLRKNLTNAGLVNISYLIVNHQEKLSRDLYQNFTDLVSRDIPVYQQNVHQPNIWKLLQGVTDDFLIYDRCGHLTYHLGLPYTLLTLPYVETAIRMTYCQNICSGCSVMVRINQYVLSLILFNDVNWNIYVWNTQWFGLQTLKHGDGFYIL
uniref:Selenoprotein P N-terminal domain-containing protein n=1 Tax=Callorhinchus milii TaxID=7868 RepID=A0A4W3I011_CALMI